MQATIPAPYRTTSYARPEATLRLARRVDTPDGAQLATFVYGPANVALNDLLSHDPVLALHGNGGSHASFNAVTDTLVSAGLAVIAIDARAQGQSSRGALPLSYELFANDAICVLDALQVEAAHVLGHSDGGIEALLLARDHARHVSSIVAGGANITPDGVIDEWDTAGSVARAHDYVEWVRGAGVPAEIDRTLLPLATDVSLDAELLKLMLDEPHIDAASLAAITCPVCVLVGEHDCIAREETELIARSIPGARLVTIAGQGHSLPRKAPDAVACQVLVNVTLAHRLHASVIP